MNSVSIDLRDLSQMLEEVAQLFVLTIIYDRNLCSFNNLLWSMWTNFEGWCSYELKIRRSKKKKKTLLYSCTNDWKVHLGSFFFFFFPTCSKIWHWEQMNISYILKRILTLYRACIRSTSILTRDIMVQFFFKKKN